jgi:hypothetical protein
VTHDAVAASSTDRVVGLCDGAIIDAGELESTAGPRDAHLEPRAPDPLVDSIKGVFHLPIK